MKKSKNVNLNLIYILLIFGGLSNILSVFRPSILHRLNPIRDFYYIPLIEFSSTMVVLTGIFFLTVANGVRKRNKNAWKFAVYLTLVSSISHLIRGFDLPLFLESTVILFLLMYSADEFKIDPKPEKLKEDIFKLLGDLAIFIIYSFLGFFLLRHHFEHLTFVKMLTGTFYNALGISTGFDSVKIGTASWFLKSLPIIFVIIVGKFFLNYFNTFFYTKPDNISIDLIEELKKYGSDTLSYFSTNYKKSIFSVAEIDGFISYTISNNIVMASSDPVCDDKDTKDMVKKFKKYWNDRALSSAFVSIQNENLEIYKSLDYKVLKIGEEAIVDVQKFDLENDYPGKSGWKFRRAVRKVAQDGILFKVSKIDQLDASIYSQMIELNKSWLETFGGGRERGFSMTLSRVPNNFDKDCLFAYAYTTDSSAAKLIGYMVFVPIYKSRGYSLDEMRRTQDAPNGLNEFIIVNTINYLKNENINLLSLNFAPLLDTNQDTQGILKQIQTLLTKYASGVLYIDSLYKFNDKFNPKWSSRYLVYENTSDIIKVFAALLNLEASVSLDLNIPKKLLEALKPWK